MVMDFLKGIGQVIQAPMHAVQTPIGDMLQAVGATQQGGVEGFGERMRQPGLITRNLETAGDALDPITSGLNIPRAIARTSNAIMPIAGDMVTDPLSYVGLGLPAKAATVAKGLGASEGVMRMIGVMDKLDTTAQAAMNAAMVKAPAAGLRAVGKLPVGTRQVLGQNPTTMLPETKTISTLGELLGTTSKQSNLKMYARNLRDGVETLLQQGHSLDDDAALLSQGGLDELLKDLPDQQQGVMRQALPAMTARLKTINAAQDKFETGIRELWESRPDLGPYIEMTPATRAARLPQINERLDALGLPPVQNSIELLQGLRGKVRDDLWNQLDKNVKSYPGGDLLLDDPYLLAMDRAVRAHAPSWASTRNTVSVGASRKSQARRRPCSKNAPYPRSPTPLRTP
jgi:hypothetical protein